MDLGSLDRFYTNFVARDLFAKVVPGAILLLTIAWSINDGKIDPVLAKVKDMPGWAWPFVYGICYATGFSIQSIGEILFILSPHPRVPRGNGYPEFLERLVDFDRLVSNERHRMARERLVVIKEMAGHVAFSSLLAFIIWVLVSVRNDSFNIKKANLASIVLIGISSLYWLNLIIRWRQRELERKVINPAYDIVEHPLMDKWRRLIFPVIFLIIVIAIQMWVRYFRL